MRFLTEHLQCWSTLNWGQILMEWTYLNDKNIVKGLKWNKNQFMDQRETSKIGKGP